MPIRKRATGQNFEDKAIRAALRAGLAKIRQDFIDFGDTWTDREHMDHDKLVAWYERKLTGQGDYHLLRTTPRSC